LWTNKIIDIIVNIKKAGRDLLYFACHYIKYVYFILVLPSMKRRFSFCIDFKVLSNMLRLCMLQCYYIYFIAILGRIPK